MGRVISGRAPGRATPAAHPQGGQGIGWAGTIAVRQPNCPRMLPASCLRVQNASSTWAKQQPQLTQEGIIDLDDPPRRAGPFAGTPSGRPRTSSGAAANKSRRWPPLAWLDATDARHQRRPGAAACAGIPPTHRDHAGMLVFATGHLQGEDGERTVALDWDALARPRQTVVIHGHGHAAHHLHPTHRTWPGRRNPAALVERTGLTSAPSWARCAPACADEQHGVHPPALIMIGGTVSLQEHIGGAALR